jgi:hypothetical protein
VFEVFDVKVYHFLKLVFHLLEFLVFLPHIVVIGLFFLCKYPLQPINLLILLRPNLLHPLVNNILDSLLLLQRLLQLMNLIRHILLSFLILSSNLLLVQLDSLLRSNALVLEGDLGLMLQELVALFPFGDLLEEVCFL